jgi:3'-5' exoribonuclease
MGCLGFELVNVREQQVDRVFKVRGRRPLVLDDGAGGVEAVVAPELEALCEPGAYVHVSGAFEGERIVVARLRPADGPAHAPAQMEADLRELIATVQEPHLRRLLDRVLGPGAQAWGAFRDAPAAKRYHQAYRHGLLEHCLSVAQAVSAISATFGGIDRDVAVTGALLHDIGKLEAYTADPLAIELTDVGKLHGEIALGYYRVRREIEAMPGFPDELAAAVLHIILSHHGTLEHGSPVVPCTREATLVHMIDNLGGRLGSFDRLERELPAGTRWSGYDRALGAGAWFASRERAAA